jgi:hypothetical protein
MNYIPGFSNYLQAAVPRYARGGRAQFDEPMMYDVDRFEDLYQYAEPVYNEPVYDVPYVDPYMSAEPMYNEPVYNEPYVNPYQYADPYQYDAPVYNEPVYNAPVYNEPYVDPYMSAEPMYPAPSYNEPYVEPYQYAEPAYSEPVYTPAVEPMTQEAAPAEAAAPYDLSALAGLDLSGLNNLYGMNFASDFGGGLQGGGIYPTNPDLQMFQAPLSNKGNPTAYGDNYISVTSPTQVFRLFDKNTGQVVYEGAGYEGAQEAIKRASALTAEGGAKAQWQIQTPNAQQESGYSVVANEKRNQSTLGDIASFALPVAMAIATGGMSLPAQMAGGLMAGAAGAGLAGKDPVKAGLLSAATAGLGNVTGANEAIGKAISGIGGTLAGKTAEEVAKQATGDIVVTGLSKALQGAGAGALQGLASGASSNLGGLTGYKTPAEQFAEQPLPEAFRPPVDDTINVIANKAASAAPNIGGALAGVTGPIATDFLPKGGLPEPLPSEPVVQEPMVQEPAAPEPYKPIIGDYANVDPIVVTGGGSTTGLDALAGLGGGITASLPALGGLAADPFLSQPTPTQQPTTAEPDDIVVEATKRVDPAEVIGGSVAAGLPALTELAMDPTLAPSDEIVVTGNKAIPRTVVPDELAPIGSVLAGLGIPQVPTPDPALTNSNKLTAKDIADYLRLASLGVSTVGGLLGGDKGNGAKFNIPAGTGALSSLFSKQLPTSTLPGGGALPASTLAAQGFNSPQDYYRYGYGPEQSFFSYATQGAPNTSRAYTGYEGSTAENRFAPQPMRMPQPVLPQPITTPIPNNPAGPSMYAPAADDMRFARGGFAVEGAGDGRDDKIPALLSDGEYVIDAETVALLGNGSNKAGAELLDSFRVKVRKQKGKKLARGKFSDNAKRPEHYLAGGKA